MQRTYSYRARESTGTLVTGTLVASSPSEVAAQLRADGKFVLGVNEHALTETVALDADAIRRGEAAKRVKRDDVIAFSQQLGVMMETGVTLADALDAFQRQSKNLEFKRVLASLTDDVHGGERFSAALAKWPRVFPSVMISLMKASEASGTMALMLSRVGSYLGKERRTAKQIKGALSYPIFMLAIGLSITVGLVAFVLPRFAAIYAQRSATLPLPTRILMGISDFFTSQYMVYGPGLIAAAIGGYFFVRSNSGRVTLDWIRLNLPILRRLYGQLYLTRAARTMSTLLAAGVGLLDIIDICRGVTQNHAWSRLWDRLDAQIRNGLQLSDALAGSRVVPPNVVSMIAAGEKSGRLAEVMERIAEFSDEELDLAVKQATTFIEPVMICLMGGIVGSVAIALLMPIFTIGNVVAH